MELKRWAGTDYEKHGLSCQGSWDIFSSGDEEPLNDFKQEESMLRLMF